MRVTVLGGCGAWPDAGQACGGYLVEHDGFRLLLDPGYATVPRLLRHVRAEQIDAVLVSHGHPDHCADLNPLLRARVLGGSGPPPLPVHAPPGALDAVLALDAPHMLAGSYTLVPLRSGDGRDIGPFRVTARELPHWVPNVGVRLATGGGTVAYTGDAGPDPGLVELARDADLLLAEASHVDEVPERSRRYLSSARHVGRQATVAGARRLLLTHLLPGTDREAARAAAADGYPGPLGVATPDLVIDLG